MSVRAALSIALAVALAAPASRAADPAANARELFQKGVQALAANRSQEAIDSFEAAYKSSSSPSMLFYLGEAYRQAGNRSKALEEYQAYVEKMPAGPKRADADAHIAELKKGGAAAPAPAPAPAKRKMALDDMDLKNETAKEPAKEAAKEPAKPAKKMQLDDLDLGTAAAPSPAVAAQPPKEKHRRSRKSEETAVAQVPAQPAPAAVVSAKEVAPAVAPMPAPAPAPVAAKPAAEPESVRPAPAVAESDLPRPSALPKNSAPSINPSQPTRPAEPIRESAPLTPEDIELARVMAAAPRGSKVAATVPSTKPAPVAAPPVPDALPGALPRPSSRLTPPPKIATAEPAPAASMPRAESYATPEVAVISAPQPSGSPGGTQRAVGLVVGTVGIAALATGGLFGVGARDAANDLNALSKEGSPYDPSIQDRGQKDQRFEIAFLAAGGAALVTGVLLYFLSPSSSPGPSSADAVPAKKDGSVRLAAAGVAPVPGGMTATAQLSF